MSVCPHPAFSPQSRVKLESAVGACLKLYPKGNCLKGPHGPIGTWDVSRITVMSRMFAHAKSFDSDLSKWDVSRVKNMQGMFLGATSFNGDLSKWDVSRVNDMHGMFLGATRFRRTLCGSAWVHSSAKQTVMFEGSSGSISSTVCTATTIPIVFSPQSRAELKSAVDAYLEYSVKGHDSNGPHGPIGEWDVSDITDMSSIFADSSSEFAITDFNSDISKWDVSRVTNTSRMFAYAESFNGDLSKWDLSRVQDMSGMFWGASSFKGDVSEWDVSRVIDMSRMFFYARSFNAEISKWDVSRVADMRQMFLGASSFNRDLSKWDVSNVNDMDGMFMGATLFKRELCGFAWLHSSANQHVMFEGSPGSIPPTTCRFSPQTRAELKSAVADYLDYSMKNNGSKFLHGPISEWDVSRITDMSRMFFYARSFNDNISHWDVSSATNMRHMFWGALSFDGDLSKWDVSRVRDTNSMFRHAPSFNGDLSKWDVSRVTNMLGMFSQATSFNCDISNWNVSSVKDMQSMFDGAAAFAQNLCTDAWVNSKAVKTEMFEGSSGSMPPTVCTITTAPPAFSPQSRAKLKSAVDAYVDFSAKGDAQTHGTFVCKAAV